jgi:phage repressor protein C with HTH and peptisase S24 domain
MLINHVTYCKHTYPINASMLIEDCCKVSYMKSIGEILKEARESRAMSQEKVANAVRKITGETFSRAALAQIESGSTKNPKPFNLQAACDVLHIDFRSALKGEMIVETTMPGLKGDLSVEPGPEFQAVHYGSFRLQAGVVGFAVDMEDEDNAPLFFRADWLKSEGLKAKNLTARKISGDSMSPGLQDGDTVLIDTSRIELKDGKVFAVNYEGELVIKRMMRDAGQWWLASDNPDKTRYPHKLCAGDLCLIIGQCVHKQSTMI